MIEAFQGLGRIKTLELAESEATEPNRLIYPAYVGGVSLAVGLLVLGIGLIRRRPLLDQHL